MVIYSFIKTKRSIKKYELFYDTNINKYIFSFTGIIAKTTHTFQLFSRFKTIYELYCC